MAIISFDSINPYQSGNATVSDVQFESNRVTIWFKLTNGKAIREYYRLSKPREKERFLDVVTTLLGSTPDQLGTDTLIGLTCYVQLEDRPWKEGKTWSGVAKVLPYCENEEGESVDNWSTEADENTEFVESKQIESVNITNLLIIRI
ncbi:hypothetical protein UF75_3715 [Desulfosporosinus sp. I2]|uniref:hypothetical protein n=1 Tax=Desulfosporosinus sp. I2 TaxID=1617025 RepID=UPI0005F08561|nr:hypothetical protein [Desulfosporosinus sp. I2]KJR45912.1 hypothetical protein UF75_3715 [Desulfosporosinus sp. I2]